MMQILSEFANSVLWKRVRETVCDDWTSKCCFSCLQVEKNKVSDSLNTLDTTGKSDVRAQFCSYR